MRAGRAGSRGPLHLLALLLLAGVVVLACGARQSPAERQESARPAVLALQAGRFADAARGAEDALAKDDKNALARAVRAIATWEKTADELAEEAIILVGGSVRRRPDFDRLRASLLKAEATLARVDEDLAVAEEDKAFALELCIACWKGDWNHDGREDRRDEHLLEIEADATGAPLADEDPRRRPTFRLDAGDVQWARAMVAFQRALLDLVVAYRWKDLLGFKESRGEGVLVVHLDDAGRVHAARDRILEGLDHSDRARRAYLAETDDDREWVPNPRQKNHPLPLPVDEALYATWDGVLGDTRRLVRSEEGFDVRELMGFAHVEGRQERTGAHGFIDVGKLLSSPHDLHVDLDVLEHTRQSPDAALRSVLGDAYVGEMRRSPLPRRLMRMADELARGEESFGRKLRYLLWLN